MMGNVLAMKKICVPLTTDSAFLPTKVWSVEAQYASLLKSPY